MNKRVIGTLLLVLWWCLVSCTPGGVDNAPDPPSTTTTPVDEPPTTTPPEPPPPVPDGPRPGDYIKIVRVPAILEWQSSANIGLIAGAQALWWAGSKDVLNVLANCPWAFEGGEPYLGMAKDEADAFAGIAESLTAKARVMFIPRFPRVNRRCDVDHEQHHPDFCKVTNIRKSVYAPFGAIGSPDKPRGLFWHHLDRANVMRARAGRCRNAIRAAGGEGFDSVAGWCTAMNELGWRSENCP